MRCDGSGQKVRQHQFACATEFHLDASSPGRPTPVQRSADLKFGFSAPLFFQHGSLLHRRSFAIFSWTHSHWINYKKTTLRSIGHNPRLGQRGVSMGELSVTGRTTFLADVRAHQQGWSKRELGHLHRAAELMRAGRLPVGTDCGVTDEGDPWFVFCDAETGEVVAHFARIGRRYVACVPFHNGALIGPVFPDVIEQFLQQRTVARPISVSIRSTPAA